MQPNYTTVLSGEYVQFNTPSGSDSDTLWALEPRLDRPSDVPRKPQDAWPSPQQILSMDYGVCISNSTDSPILLKNGKQLCQVRHILPIDVSTSTAHNAVSPSLATCKPFSSHVILNPDGCLDQDTRDKFTAVNLKFDDVFNPSISK